MLRENLAIRRKPKREKGDIKTLATNYQTIREIEHALADLYFLLKEIQLKIYKE